MSTVQFKDLFSFAVESQNSFRKKWEPFVRTESNIASNNNEVEILKRLQSRLEENYPFFHPRYAGQMIKPPHEIATAAYVMAMQINPNNHALDGGPATAKMETEVVEKIAQMFGYKDHLGHLTSSGTIANLEALWIARSIHPEKAIAFSSSSHYTHRRMCEVIGAKYISLDTFDNLEETILKHSIGTIVVTIGTTSTGEIDPLHDILPIAQKHGVRIHADAAYGGFFTLLAKSDKPIIEPKPFLLLKDCDSIVVDPHKHALQPYGCGCVLFKDPGVGRFYKHESPYTYFTSNELHLGEISLECSRAGAAAAALWATLECFPLESDRGLGLILQQTRRASLLFSKLISGSTILAEYQIPQLDINTYFPRTIPFSATETSLVVEKIFKGLMERDKNPIYLATLLVDSKTIRDIHPDFICDEPKTKILRSVLMKPEHEMFASTLLSEIEDFTMTI